MMVAFRYDNEAVGSLYYSREIPSLLRGLRLSKLYGRKRHHHVRIERPVRARPGKGLPRLMFPGFRDIRGYQAMYRDFVARDPDRPGAGDEPRAGDGRPAAHGPDLRAASEQRRSRWRSEAASFGMQTRALTTSSSSAAAPAAATIAHALAPSSARILVLERGDFVPQEEENWNPGGGLEAPALPRPRAMARPAAAEEFQPYTHYCVGGNTKFWGSVLYRLRREDFQAVEHVDGVSPAWPIDYETLEPYYERAECLYHVRGQHGVDPTEPSAASRIRTTRFRTRRAWRRSSSSCGARACIRRRCRSGCCGPAQEDGCVLCNTCNSFPCKVHAKSDADVCCIRPPLQHPTVTLWTERARAAAARPMHAGRKVEAVEVERNGETAPRRGAARHRLVRRRELGGAAAAIRHTTKHPHGLANSSGLVGRRYMAHLATMMQGFHPFRRNDTVFQKTVGINDFYLRGPMADTRSARFSRRDGRTASWRRRSRRGFRCGRTTRGWRAASTGW